MSPTLEQRVATLENQNKVLKRCGLIAAIGLVAAFVLGAKAQEPVPNTIRARHFEVVGNNGVVRAGFGEFRNGVGLFLQEGTRARAALALVDGKPLLDLYDKAGRGRLNLQVEADGSPQINLIDVAGKVFWDAP